LFAVESTSTLYMCGHAGWRLRYAGRPGSTTFLGDQGNADRLLEWLNAQPPLDVTGADPDDPTTWHDLLSFELTERRRCGHRVFRVTRVGQPGHAELVEESVLAAARVIDWASRQLRPRHDTGDIDA
jgi:hypothetical protein